MFTRNQLWRSATSNLRRIAEKIVPGMTRREEEVTNPELIHLRAEVARLESLQYLMQESCGWFEKSRSRWELSPYIEAPAAEFADLRGEPDPTVGPAPGGIYSKARGDAAYVTAFRRIFDYIVGTGITGDIIEFGTYRGYTARIIAQLINEMSLPSHLYLFDSFEGLPKIYSPIDSQSYEVAQNVSWFQGQMNQQTGMDRIISGALSCVLEPSRLHAVKGYYEDTVPKLVPDCKFSLVHIDCDLYASAKIVLDSLIERSQFQDGCVIAFDDFNCNRARPDMGERRALRDSFGAQNRYECHEFFSYAWSARAFLVHDREAQPRQNATRTDAA